MNRRNSKLAPKEHDHPIPMANPRSPLIFDSQYVTRDDGELECVKIQLLDADENVLGTWFMSNPPK
jgi:hypothetical protein